jgi:hypothetical protein
VAAGVIPPEARRALEPAGSDRITNHAGIEVGAILGVVRLVQEAT